MNSNTTAPPDTKKKRRARLLLLLLLLLALLLLVAGLFFLLRSPRLQGVRNALGGIFGRQPPAAGSQMAPDSLPLADSAALSDSLARADSLERLADSLAREAYLDSLQKARAAARIDARLKAAVPAADSTDSAATDTVLEPCDLDTVPPWIFPDPSGGLHRRHVAVRLLSVEPCAIEWRFAGRPWQRYTGEPILITKNTTIEFTARDTCGNVLPTRTEIYTITRPLENRRCPDDMEFVKVADNEFCIDRYEWPNKRREKPRSYVSIYQARDSCYTAGKRLCTTDEWVMACGGAYVWKYPYGGVYEPRACNTQDTAVYAAGALAECRGYFDVYDMSGNLAEWTNTPSDRNRQFYNVMGGFWDSGPQSTCYEKRYSYFPQNRHNPVGFRCCRDAEAEEGTGK